MKGNSKAFVLGLVVGAVAYHFIMMANSQGTQSG